MMAGIPEFGVRPSVPLWTLMALTPKWLVFPRGRNTRLLRIANEGGGERIVLTHACGDIGEEGDPRLAQAAVVREIRGEDRSRERNVPMSLGCPFVSFKRRGLSKFPKVGVIVDRIARSESVSASSSVAGFGKTATYGSNATASSAMAIEASILMANPVAYSGRGFRRIISAPRSSAYDSP